MVSVYCSGTGLVECGLICTARPDAPADTVHRLAVVCQMVGLVETPLNVSRFFLCLHSILRSAHLHGRPAPGCTPPCWQSFQPRRCRIAPAREVPRLLAMAASSRSSSALTRSLMISTLIPPC